VIDPLTPCSGNVKFCGSEEESTCPNIEQAPDSSSNSLRVMGGTF
jgi:hypothetical protein